MVDCGTQTETAEKETQCNLGAAEAVHPDTPSLGAFSPDRAFFDFLKDLVGVISGWTGSQSGGRDATRKMGEIIFKHYNIDIGTGEQPRLGSCSKNTITSKKKKNGPRK